MALYSVECGTQTFAVKIFHKLDKTQAREKYFSEKLASASLAPTVYYADKSANFLITDYKKGGDLSQKDCKTIDLALLATTLARFHAFNNFSHEFQAVPFFERAYQAYKKAYKKIEACGWSDRISDIFEYLYSEKRNDIAQQGLVHGDLIPGNILVDDNRYLFIDFESTEISDSSLDLGILLSYIYLYRPDQATAFLKSYFKRPLLPKESEHVDSMVILASLYYGYLHIMKDDAKTQEEGCSFLKQALRLYDSCMGEK